MDPAARWILFYVEVRVMIISTAFYVEQMYVRPCIGNRPKKKERKKKTKPRRITPPPTFKSSHQTPPSPLPTPSFIARHPTPSPAVMPPHQSHRHPHFVIPDSWSRGRRSRRSIRRRKRRSHRSIRRRMRTRGVPRKRDGRSCRAGAGAITAGRTLVPECRAAVARNAHLSRRRGRVSRCSRWGYCRRRKRTGVALLTGAAIFVLAAGPAPTG